MDFANQIVLVTGASRGIGAACAEAFRRRGARLSLTARDEAALASQAGPDDLITVGDLTSADFRAQLVGATLQRFGRIDILINNAGAGLYGKPSTVPLDEVRHLFELNLFAPLSLTQLVLPQMRKQNSGRIVNISSMGGEIMLPWIPLYCASKFALSALTSAVRSELSGTGIHAMTVCPGYISTEFNSNAAGPRPPAPLMGSTTGRFAITPQQCAAGILRGVERNARFIVTPRAGWVLIPAQRLFPRLVESRLTSFMKTSESEVAA